MLSARRFAHAAFAALIVFAAAPASQPRAQSAEIVAQVNEAIITNVDVEQRIRLLAFATGGREPQNARSAALDLLIDDALKLQEAKRLGVEITDDEVSEAIAQIARNNQLTEEQLYGAMGSAGVSRMVLREQVRAELAWTRIIRGRYGASLDPSEGEIEAAMGNSVSADDVYSMVQLVVSLPQNASQSATQTAMQRVDALRAGMTDCDTAKQMAASAGPPSGDLGASPVNRMPPPVRDQVTGLGVGDITEPIRSNVGIHLIMICDIQRSGGGADRDRIVAQLRQQKGQRISDSYVADLRRNALITYPQ